MVNAEASSAPPPTHPFLPGVCVLTVPPRPRGARLRRWFVIEGPTVVYYDRSERGGVQTDTRKGDVSLAGALSIGVSQAPSADPTELQIVTPARTYRFRAANTEERDTWIAALTSAATAVGGIRGGANDLARGNYCTLSLCRWDRLTITHATPETVAALRTRIQTSWPKGLQDETVRGDDLVEFKIRGTPWMA